VRELGHTLAPAFAPDAEAAKAELSRRLRAEVRRIYDGFEAMRSTVPWNTARMPAPGAVVTSMPTSSPRPPRECTSSVSRQR